MSSAALRELELVDHSAAINAMIDGAAGEVLGAARFAELSRFCNWMLREHDVDVRDAIKHADAYNELNLLPELKPEQVAQVVLDTFVAKTTGDRIKLELVEDSKPDEQPPFEKALIRFKPENLSEGADAAERAMLADHDSEPLLSHGGQYVTVRRCRSTTVGGMQSDASVYTIFRYDDASLRERLMSSNDFEIWKGKTWTRVKAPDEVIQTLLSRGGGIARPLIGLLPAPIVLPDGRVKQTPGYDAGTGLYAAFEAGTFPQLRSYLTCSQFDNPNVQEVEAAAALRRYSAERELALTEAQSALQWLKREVFAEFCFQDAVDEAALVAALLTGILRAVCGRAPAFLLSSPVQATGKTTAASVIGTAVEGSPPGLNSWPEDDSELEKIILSALRAGNRVLLFDNLRNGLIVRSDKLAKLLSAEIIQGRILGQSRMVALPADVLVLLTGNNVGLEGDMNSRVIEVYLDSKLERPDRRTFRRNVIDWVREHRAEVVSKALTITKAYIDAGAPVVSDKPTRYPVWDRMVRLPLIWAGAADIAVKIDKAHDSDALLGSLRDVINAWQPALGTEPLTAGQIVPKLESSGFSPETSELQRALQVLIGDRRGASLTAQSIGLRLKQFASRPVDGRAIVSAFDNHRKVQTWTVGRVGGAA